MGELSNNLGESYAPTGDQTQARPDERSCAGEGSAAFAGVADGRIAAAGDNSRLLASYGIWLRQLR